MKREIMRNFTFGRLHNASFENKELIDCTFTGFIMNTKFINSRLENCKFLEETMNTEFINSPTINCEFKDNTQNISFYYDAPKVKENKPEYYQPKELNFGED